MVRPQDIFPRGEGSLLDADTVDGLHARDLLNAVKPPSWDQIPGLPSTFPPAAHTHELQHHGSSHWLGGDDPAFPEEVAQGLAAAEHPSSSNPYVTRSSVARRYVMSSPSVVWTVAHNLGREPIVRVFTMGGQEIEAEVVHVSSNLVSVLFVEPTAGVLVVA